MTAALSIIIPSHRRADMLAKCLHSVRTHAPADCEIIVIDDGSPRAIISETARSFDVRVLRFDTSQGFCRAVNAGIQASQAPIIELLNDDAEVTAHWTDAPLRCFDDPQVGAVAPLILLAGTESSPRVDSAGDSYDPGGFARKRGHGHPLTAAHQQARPVFGACGAAAFYRRAALERTGLFPESFGAYFEDVDLAFRMHWAGYRVHYEPQSQVWHAGSASYGRTHRRLLERQSCNEERVFWRNLPTRLLWRYLPRHVAVLVGKSLRRMQEGQFLPFLMGRLRVLGEWRDILAHRQRLSTLSPAPPDFDWSTDM